jgi:hypothetical protein
MHSFVKSPDVLKKNFLGLTKCALSPGFGGEGRELVQPAMPAHKEFARPAQCHLLVFRADLLDLHHYVVILLVGFFDLICRVDHRNDVFAFEILADAAAKS